jgi:hypothetical protein
LPRLASNHDPSDLYLLSSWDYRHEPLAPGHILSLVRDRLQVNKTLWC